jgi:hypothetical protein
VIGYQEKLARVLDRMGGLYTLDDILTRIGDGRMQTFVERDSWLITQVVDFPRARQLQFVAMVGDLDDIDPLQAQALDYADKANAGLISAYGRRGWIEHARERGWRLKARNYLYHRDM